MESLFSPVLLYGAMALGAVGVLVSLPRKGLSPQILGLLIAAIGIGGVLMAVTIANAETLPNINFYVLGAVAFLASLRMISHPKPVYAALYFILTIVAACGLYVLLAAEFMAFALVIVYAGAILITYLFVIMLATQAPTDEDVEVLSEYDRYSREPVPAVIIGFVLAGVLTAMLGRGVAGMPPDLVYEDGAKIALLPKKVERILRADGLLEADEELATTEAGVVLVNFETRTFVAELSESGVRREVGPIPEPLWPADLALANVEGVGFELLVAKPGAIEIAGVILLMAMLGAVVLARKKVEMDEAEKMMGAANASAGPAVAGGNGRAM